MIRFTFAVQQFAENMQKDIKPNDSITTTQQIYPTCLERLEISHDRMKYQ